MPRKKTNRLALCGLALLSASISTHRLHAVDAPAATQPIDASKLDHWSFKPPVRPAVPTPAEASRVVNPIDAFILQRLQTEKLTLSAPADRQTLIRRAYFDVIGLPPTPEEIDAFVADADPKAYEKLIDRLLASPRYGERWARHWLDVVRFAESNGFETNQERANAWRYRDWVIASLNADEPYDQFVREQLAGDALGADAATGFLVGGAVDLVLSPDPVLTANQRSDELHDMVSTTGSAFLGLTVGCARCHDHKFDPISQVDYFRITADLAGVRHGERAIRSADSEAKSRQAKELSLRLNQLQNYLSAFEPLARPRQPILVVDDPNVTQLLPAVGREPHREGTGPGERHDAGAAGRMPNVGRGYYYWTDVANRDVFTWNPNRAGRYRVWLSWGSGFDTHAPDASYFLDADGDLATTNDRTLIASVDQRHFAGGQGKMYPPGRPLWSGFLDAGVHDLTPTSRIVLHGGAASNSYVGADTMLLESAPLEAQTASAGVLPAVRSGVRIRRNVDRFAPVKAKYVRFTVLATSNLEPCIDELEIYGPAQPSLNLALATGGAKASASGTYPNSDLHKLEHINDGQYGNAHSWISNEAGKGWVEIELPAELDVDRIVWGRDHDAQYRDRLATQYRIEVATEPGQWTLASDSEDRLPFALDDSVQELAALPPNASVADASHLAALMNERAEVRLQLDAVSQPAPMAYAGTFLQPGTTHRLSRGDPMQPKEPVNPGSLAAIGKPLDLPDATPEQQRRLKLAEWITDPANPLTARVIVNRLWLHHFGQGLVGTPSDFGNMGAKPTHPELLDWLATELVSQGWHLKPIQRLILLSNTYRQSGESQPDALTRDAGSTLLWRYPPRRLEAEAIRDTVLAVSGQLNLTMGGPGFSVFKDNGNYVRVYEPKEVWGPTEFRRMVYHLKIRSQHDATFGAFDCPDGAQIAPKRASSTTPLQALNLLNSSFMLQESEAFGERLKTEAGGNSVAEVDRGFRLALGRSPNEKERTAGAQLIDQYGVATFCRALYNANEFVYAR